MPAASAFPALAMDPFAAEDAQPTSERAEKLFGIADEDAVSDGRSTDTGSDQSSEGDRGVLSIFDWDDTLFPTSWLSDCDLLFAPSLAGLKESFRAALAELAEAAEEALQQALALGRVVIVTNAAEGWVQDSCRRLMPSLAPTLAQLRIVSARALAEPLGVRSPTEWKTLAFRAEVRAFRAQLGDEGRCSVLALGDSVHEHSALLQAAGEHERCLAKSLKFAERPSIEQLVEELRLASGGLEEIVEFDGDLDVDVGGCA